MRFSSLPSLLGQEHFAVVTAIVAIPLIFPGSSAAVIINTESNCSHLFGTYYVPGAVPSASNLSSHTHLSNPQLSSKLWLHTRDPEIGHWKSRLLASNLLAQVFLLVSLLANRKGYLCSLCNTQWLWTVRPLGWREAWSLPADKEAFMWTVVWTCRALGGCEVGKAS